MIKTTLAIALLLGANALQSRTRVMDHDGEAYLGNQTTYTSITVTVEELEEVKKFWENRELEELCVRLYTEYYNKATLITQLEIEADAILEEYNHKCHEHCLDGYINCPLPDYDYEPCMTHDDCCEAQHPGWEWCTSGTPVFE